MNKFLLIVSLAAMCGCVNFYLENIFTIPFLGLPCAEDAVCEACIDTACLPFDWPMSATRCKEGG